jgi:hypothetical protein
LTNEKKTENVALMIDLAPWDLEPDLTRERLGWIAQRFMEVRREARSEYSPAKGDTPWSFGCMCYSRQMFAIASAARSGEFPWLQVIDSSLKFVFCVGRVRARFYKGDAERPRENLRQSFAELRQRTLPFGKSLLPGTASSSLAWCFAVETDDSGLVSRVTLAAFSGDKDELVLSYDIPLGDTDARSITFMPPPPPVPIAPPVVFAPFEKKKASDDNEGND